MFTRGTRLRAMIRRGNCPGGPPLPNATVPP